MRPVALLVALAVLLLADAAAAQLVHHAGAHPFAVGAGEGAVGRQNALGAWLLGWESRFYLALTQAVRAAGAGAAGMAGLAGLSFLYGVCHAAGPGHGKAVIASYMVSNEVALRRGLLISLGAALLQAAVATVLVGASVYLFHATAPRMTAASRLVELAGYAGIVVLGLVLCRRKGRALRQGLRASFAQGTRAQGTRAQGTRAQGSREGPARPAGRAPFPATLAAWAEPPLAFAALPPAALRLHPTPGAGGRFRADDGSAPHGAGCACRHMPDPAAFAAPRLDGRTAALAVLTAGARPCSGAILVLVFAASQGLFAAGVAATLAMALGTALTTGALACGAVFAKGQVLRLAGRASPRVELAGRCLEFAAAAAVLLFGAALLAAWAGGLPAGA